MAPVLTTPWRRLQRRQAPPVLDEGELPCTGDPPRSRPRIGRDDDGRTSLDPDGRTRPREQPNRAGSRSFATFSASVRPEPPPRTGGGATGFEPIPGPPSQVGGGADRATGGDVPEAEARPRPPQHRPRGPAPSPGWRPAERLSRYHRPARRLRSAPRTEADERGRRDAPSARTLLRRCPATHAGDPLRFMTR